MLSCSNQKLFAFVTAHTHMSVGMGSFKGAFPFDYITYMYMSQQLHDNPPQRAICVGVGSYTKPM